MTQTRPIRVAGGLAVGWGAVLLCWAAYNCFGQVGFGTYVEGIFYYGGSSVDAETGSLNYGLLYLIAGLLLLRGRGWALAVAAGVAGVEGYNRVRSLTGALLDKPQREWFTHTTEGQLKIATFALGVIVSATLILLLARSTWGERPEVAAAAEQPHWSILQTVPATGVPAQQPYPQPPLVQQPQQPQPQPQQAAWPQQPPAQPAWQQQPQPQPYQPQPQPPYQQQPVPQPPAAWPPQQPAPYGHPPTLPQQQWPAAPPAPGPVTPGPVVPPPADRPPADRPPADRPPQG
ncbi:hypothetical protein [Streptomyces rubellomurinus]|uniref:hypothetical protein n=1 Tax=Streptomyces rubellomurinus (strain ATCC 31215) TaxID=359131 RepID=UPI000AF88E06|nr:hypothetical protein [Streptomyces rubellomurinus]